MEELPPKEPLAAAFAIETFYALGMKTELGPDGHPVFVDLPIPEHWIVASGVGHVGINHRTGTIEGY